jgi:hypothetical protein
MTLLPQLFRVVEEEDVVLVDVDEELDDVVGCSIVVEVVVGHWQFTHSCGVQNAPAAEPSHCSP